MTDVDRTVSVACPSLCPFPTIKSIPAVIKKKKIQVELICREAALGRYT